jgi:putative ABC transport system permease protein
VSTDADASSAVNGVSGHVAAMLRHHGGDLAAFPTSHEAPKFTIEAIAAASTMHGGDVVAGRILAAGDGDGIVVNEALAALAGDVRVGDALAFTAGGHALTPRVLGIVREPFAQPGAYVLRDEGVFANHPGLGNTLRLRFATADAATRDRARAALEERFAAANVPVTGSRTVAETRYVFVQHFVMVYDCLVGLAALVLLVGAFALVSLLGLDAIERRSEFAVLRALGARRRTIGALVLAQGGRLAALGWGVAMLAAWGLASIGGVARLFPTRLDPLHDGTAPWVWLAVAGIAGLLATVLPALRASRTTIREALTRA